MQLAICCPQAPVHGDGGGQLVRHSVRPDRHALRAAATSARQVVRHCPGELLERQVARQDEKAVRAISMQVRLATAQPDVHAAPDAERGAAASSATDNAARTYLRFMRQPPLWPPPIS